MAISDIGQNLQPFNGSGDVSKSPNEWNILEWNEKLQTNKPSLVFEDHISVHVSYTFTSFLSYEKITSIVRL